MDGYRVCSWGVIWRGRDVCGHSLVVRWSVSAMRAPTKEFDFRLMRRGLKPHNLDRAQINADDKCALGSVAVDVFMCASNAGATFQEALLAVYLTGVENGSAAAREAN